MCVPAGGDGWVLFSFESTDRRAAILASSELPDTQVIVAFCSSKTDKHQDLYMWQ